MVLLYLQEKLRIKLKVIASEIFVCSLAIRKYKYYGVIFGNNRKYKIYSTTFFILSLMAVRCSLYETFDQHKFLYKLTLPSKFTYEKIIIFRFSTSEVKIIYKGIYFGKMQYTVDILRP